MAARRRRPRQQPLRLPALFGGADPLRPGRHTASRQAKARAAAPVRAAAPPPPPPVPRRRTPPGIRLTPLTDRPNDRGARGRFAGVSEGERRVAGAKYERAHRAELAEQAAAAGGKRTAHTRDAPTRARSSSSPRSRFAGRATPDELNREARRAVPKPTSPARGVARRPSTPLPGDSAGRTTAKKRQQRPELTGADYAGTQHVPARRTAGERFFGRSAGPTRYAASSSQHSQMGRPPR